MSEEQEIAELPDPAAPPRDGIDEHDHPIPRWFNLGFGASIAFAALYFPYYAFVSEWSAAAQWRAEGAAAQAQAAALRAALPANNPFRGDLGAIAEGAQIFGSICASCHQANGRGLVGPSLVDPFWKYGSADTALFETVSSGRPGGMPAWASAIGSEKIWKTLAYLETLPRSAAPGIGAPDYIPAAAGAPAPH
jgi:cytochrome c oxidase cbb3-type subunit 3